jgi:hypothetical protein
MISITVRNMSVDKTETIRLLKNQQCSTCRFSLYQERVTVKIPYEHDRLTGHRKNVEIKTWRCLNMLKTQTQVESTDYCERYEKLR